MRSINFTEDDLRAIAHERYYHPDPHVQRKMEVLWLKSHGLPHRQIADLAGVSRRTVQRYLNDYRAGGLQQVRRCLWRGPKTLPKLGEALGRGVREARREVAKTDTPESPSDPVTPIDAKRP